MTRKANARVAGFTFLFYIAVGVTGMALPSQPATTGIHVLLSLLIFITALALGVSLYALTRDSDRDLALMALCCRVGEAMFAAIGPVLTLGLAWLGQPADGEPPPAAAGATLSELLAKVSGWNTIIAGTLFAVGSTIFCYLFLQSRTIPRWMAWLGLGASLILLIALPLQLAGYASKSVVQYLWAPMALFEIPFGVWLLVTGAPLSGKAAEQQSVV
jgi:hypothetical protein